MPFESGNPIPVTVTTRPAATEPAQPVYVVNGPPMSGRARRVVPVMSGPIKNSAAIPVCDAGANALYTDDLPIPVYVVSGSLGEERATPSPPLTNLALWLKADSLVLNDSDAITTWQDSSGNARHATQASATLKPLYKAAVVNGRPGVRFDGSDDYMRTTSFVQAQPFTVYCVFTPLAWVSGRRLFDGATVNRVVLSQSPTTNRLSIYAGTAFAPAATGPAINNAVLVSAVYNGAASTISPNRAVPTTGNPGTNGISDGLTIGGAGNLSAGFFVNCDLGELLVYAGAHDASQIAEVESYFLSKFGETTRLIVFDGDSLTSGVGSTGGQTYPAQTLALLGGTWSDFNFGLSGQTVVAMSSDAASQIDSKSTIWLARRIVCIWGGTNDLFFGATPATAYASLKTYWAARRAAGYKVVAFTILPRSAGPPPPTFEADRQTLNTSIRSDPSLYDALVDVAADSRIGDAGDDLDTTYYADLVHLTNAGYAIVAGLASAAIAGIL